MAGRCVFGAIAFFSIIINVVEAMKVSLALEYLPPGGNVSCSNKPKTDYNGKVLEVFGTPMKAVAASAGYLYENRAVVGALGTIQDDYYLNATYIEHTSSQSEWEWKIVITTQGTTFEVDMTCNDLSLVEIGKVLHGIEDIPHGVQDAANNDQSVMDAGIDITQCCAFEVEYVYKGDNAGEWFFEFESCESKDNYGNRTLKDILINQTTHQIIQVENSDQNQCKPAYDSYSYGGSNDYAGGDDHYEDNTPSYEEDYEDGHYGGESPGAHQEYNNYAPPSNNNYHNYTPPPSTYNNYATRKSSYRGSYNNSTSQQ